MGWLADVAGWLGDPANWRGEGGVGTRLVEHVGLSALALLLAMVLTLPVALWLGHVGRGGALALNVGNVGRAVPTFAVLVLLVLQPPPVGRPTVATLLALVVFAVPPLLTNTYVGMREVDRDVVDSARGMGMSGWQMLRRVELPLATPLLVAGVRLAAVQVVATATIAGLVGGPGLGRIITAGFAAQDLGELVAGAVLVALLALLVEGAMAVLRGATDPERSARRRPRATGSAPTPRTVTGSFSPGG